MIMIYYWRFWEPWAGTIVGVVVVVVVAQVSNLASHVKKKVTRSPWGMQILS